VRAIEFVIDMSANIIEDVIEKSSMAIESDYQSIKHILFDHQFATRRILWDEISMQAEREKTRTIVDNR